MPKLSITFPVLEVERHPVNHIPNPSVNDGEWMIGRSLHEKSKEGKEENNS